MGKYWRDKILANGPIGEYFKYLANDKLPLPITTHYFGGASPDKGISPDKGASPCKGAHVIKIMCMIG